MSASTIARSARLRTTPQRAARELSRRRWTVLAPHPDDETLGTGALLCALADAGRPARVVYLTDGAASHVGAPAWPRTRIAALRRREARAALRALGGARAPSPVFLDWPDAAPFGPASAVFEASVARLASLLRRDGATALVTTWAHEPHCDHAAAAAVARAAVARLFGRVALYWCVVWGWRAPEAAALTGYRTLPTPRRIAHAARRRAAIARHRSQIGAVIPGCADGFILPRGMLRVEDQILFGPERP